MEITTVLVMIVALLVGAALGLLYSNSKIATLNGAKKVLEARVVELEEYKTSIETQESSFARELGPIKTIVDQLNTGLDSFKEQTNSKFGQITESLTNTNSNTAKLAETATSLKTLLGNNQERGAWGEVQLETLLTSSGLHLGRDYYKQTVLHNEDGEQIKPDYIVKLNDKHFVVIDAKFPFAAYQQAMAITDTTTKREVERRTELLDQHVKDVKKHIDEISKKVYFTGFDEARGLNDSPEMTLMFFPIESVYSETLSHDSSLYEYAIKKRVILIAPMQLFGALTTIEYMWKFRAQEENVREIIKLGTQLFERLKVVAGHAASLGTSLNSSVKHFNSFVGSIEANLLTTTRSLNQEGLKISLSGDINELKAIETQTRDFVKPELTSDQADLILPESKDGDR